MNLPDKPEQPLCRNMLPVLQFMLDEGLESLGLFWSSKLPVSDFLGDIKICQYAMQGDVTLMLPSKSFLTIVKALDPRTSIEPPD